MTKREKNEVRRLRAVHLLLKRHASVYAGYSGLERAAARLSAVLVQLDAVQALQIKGSTAITEQRNQYRTALERLMTTAFSHLLQVADDLDMDGLRRFARMTPTRIKQLKPEELVAKGSLLLAELELHAVNLEVTAFSADDRRVFSDALDLYKSWMPATREAIEIRKVGTSSVPELLKQGLDLIRGQMMGFMKRYEDSQPVFFKEFMEAKRLKRVAVHHEEEGDGETALAQGNSPKRVGQAAGALEGGALATEDADGNMLDHGLKETDENARDMLQLLRESGYSEGETP